MLYTVVANLVLPLMLAPLFNAVGAVGAMGAVGASGAERAGATVPSDLRS